MTRYSWKFFRAGGFDQVKLETGADLMHLDELDLKLWVALACPTTGLEFDPATAALIDTDHDGRIRANELIAAVKWAGSMLVNPDELLEGGESLPLSAIADPTLLASARRICANLGKPEATSISLADVSDADRIFADTTLNGDGVIIPESASDDATRGVVRDIAECMGTVPDRSKRPGIDQPQADAFFEACAAFDAWHRRAEADRSRVLPLGEQTGPAADAVRPIRAQLDDYFSRCRLGAYDPRAVALLERKEDEALALALQDGSVAASVLKSLPLARAATDRALPLEGGLNPAYVDAVARFRAEAVKPLLGERAELGETDWRRLAASLAPYEEWCAARAGTAVEKLGLPRVRDILAGAAPGAIAELIASDRALESEVAAIASVEKLIRYRRDLYRLCTNFVNFRDFYDAGEPAIFQAGTLYLDRRSCTLTLYVEDVASHARMAGLAGSYLAYCDIVHKGAGEKRQIVAAFTNGDADNLMLGRNGLFYDRHGQDWDATIIRIIDNPISIREAFWAPYKKLVRLIEEQVAKRAAEEHEAADVRLSATATGVANVDRSQPEARKVDIGTVAALGVAFGAMATAFAAIAGYLSGLLKLPFWQVCVAVAGLLMLISGPSVVMAWLKLRKRNLGPILDANGWAVNAKASVNVPFGASLTGLAKLPAGYVLSAKDRYGERPSPWPRLIKTAIGVAFGLSLLNQFYVLDGIWHLATGRHNPAWFKVAPSDGGDGGRERASTR